ncbi:hypothetical protein [Actinoplanes sp. NPDC049265]|uniref:hypothetical protein n=1 Tax=Actinoplanes sp. NPDC049265 TaxID=3363902 RepID=UPI0037103918
MNIPDRGERRPASGGLHLQMSKLLIVSIVAAIAATGALVITLLVGLPKGPPPGGPGQDGRMPPPPDLGGLAIASVVTGLFVLAWLAVLIVYSRDQILSRMETPPAEVPAEVVAGLREDLAALGDRLATLTTEYGEQRETDGYLNGMRAAAGRPPDPVVTPLRRTPPQV